MYIKEMEIQRFLKMIKMSLLLACIGKSNYPAKKSKSDLDIELEDKLEDEEYLKILKKNIIYLNKINFDFVFYIAGVDVHYDDKLGKLKLTDNGLDQKIELL